MNIESCYFYVVQRGAISMCIFVIYFLVYFCSMIEMCVKERVSNICTAYVNRTIKLNSIYTCLSPQLWRR